MPANEGVSSDAEVVTRNIYMEPKVPQPPSSSFIIRVALKQFLCGLDGNDPLVSEYPSRAAHLSYQQADEVAEYLLKRGFDAVVCDIFGRPMCAELLEAELRKMN